MTATHPPAAEAAADPSPTARWEDSSAGAECVVKVGGDWRLSRPAPVWKEFLGRHAAMNVRVVPDNLGKWDTSLLLFLVHGRSWCLQSKRSFAVEALPENLQILLRQAVEAVPPDPKARPDKRTPWERGKGSFQHLRDAARGHVSFIGECSLGIAGVARRPGQFRWLDTLVEMQQCWASALPIVSLVSFLVGVILAFQAALQLQQYGAAVFVADLVGLSVVREMGPMMAAVIMAGGIGAAFAAELGNMKVDEEMDAFETLGISTVEFLALPRIVAVTLMTPVLALYSNVLGVLGGMFVSATMLNIPASAYWTETQNRVGPLDVTSGLIKSVFFGAAIGFAGCLRGMNCERSAAGVGKATTSAVVTGILLIVIGDALFALIFNVIGI